MVRPPEVHWFKDLKKDIKIAGIGLWIYAGIQICAGMSMGWILRKFSEDFLMLAVTALSGFAAILFFKSRYQLDLKEDSKILYGKEIMQGFTWMLLISFIWSFVSIFINAFLNTIGLSDLSQNIYFSHHFFGNLCLFVSVVFVAPIVEECVFRGLLFRNFAKYHVGFAMVFSSVCFALMHMNIVQGAPTFFMGLVLAYFYWKTKSLKTSIGIHMLNNAVGMISLVANVNFGILILEVLGLVWLIQSRNELVTFFKNQKFSSDYIAYVTKNPIFQGFFVLFIFMAIVSLF